MRYNYTNARSLTITLFVSLKCILNGYSCTKLCTLPRLCYSVVPHGLVLATQHSVHCTRGNQDDALLLYNKSHLSGRQF